mgnify:CR=1 FL=1
MCFASDIFALFNNHKNKLKTINYYCFQLKMGAGASAAEHSPRTRERRGSSLHNHHGLNDFMIHNLENRTKFNKSELKTLQQHFMDLAAKQGNENTITEAEFREALASIGIVESDRVILHQVSNTSNTRHTRHTRHTHTNHIPTRRMNRSSAPWTPSR